MNLVDLFSGIGGFSLAASWTGVIEPVLFCEIDPFCQKILKKHWPHVPIHPDITTYKVGAYASASTIDIVSGGFPCQPFSVAGKRRGTEDYRNLWPEMFRVIQEARPTWVVGENVGGIIRMVLDQVLSDLESSNYQTETFVVPACAVDAPHRRDRIWFVAYSEGVGMEGNRPNRERKPRIQAREVLSGCNSTGGDRREWPTEPGVGRMAHGVPNRVDRLKALGNAIVPQVAYQIFKYIAEVENANDPDMRR